MNLETTSLFYTERPKITLTGPAIILQDTEENLLCVMENQDKAWKKTGQFFIPAGGKEDFELTMEDACLREIKEETGLNGSVIDKKYLKKTGEIEFTGDTFDIDVEIFRYTQLLATDALNNIRHSHTQEIAYKIFVPISHLLSLRKDLIRPGLYEILASGLLGHRHIKPVQIKYGMYKNPDDYIPAYRALQKEYH